MSLTDAEKQLARAIGFDESVCELVKDHSGCPIERLVGFDDQFQRIEVEGLSIAVKHEDLGRIIGGLQPEIRPQGYCASWSKIYERNGAERSDEVAILKTTDDRAIIRVKRSCGANYGVSTDDLVRKLDDWQTRCEFEVIGAAPDWVSLEFATLPDDLCGFAEEIYEFCPDSVEQGVGLMQECEHPEVFEAARKLCPTLSNRMREKLEADRQRFTELMKERPEVRALFESVANAPKASTGMGIRLLAYHLHTSRELFLWWD